MQELTNEQLTAKLQGVKAMLRRGIAGKKYAKETAKQFHALQAEHTRRGI